MSVKSFAEAVKEGITRYTRGFGIEQAEAEETEFASKVEAAAANAAALAAAPAGSPFLFGVNGAFNNHATWTPQNVLGDRGLNTEIVWENTAEAFENVSTKITEIGTSIAAGLTPVCLLNTSDTLFLGKINATNFGKAAAKVIQETIASYPTATLWEIINEPYAKAGAAKLGSNAADYAALCKAVYTEVEKLVSEGKIPAMPTLLVMVTGPYTKTSSSEVKEEESYPEKPSGKKGWIPDFFTAWAAGKTKINGYSTHPYPYENHQFAVVGHQEKGVFAGAAQHAILVAQGAVAANRLYYTEYGCTREELPGGTEAIKEEEQAAVYETQLRALWQQYGEGWLKGALAFNNNSTGFGIYGKPAATALTGFASTHTKSLSNTGVAGWPSPGVFVGPVEQTGLTTFGEEHECSSEHGTLVQVICKVAGTGTGFLEAFVKNPTGEPAIQVGEFVRENKAGDVGQINITLSFFVPPGWTWKVTKGSEATESTIKKVLYQAF